MTRSVLVLGAGGFIGRRVIQILAAADGVSPIAAGRTISAASAAGVPIERLDASDATALQAALRKVDAVVNCVAGPAMGPVAEALFRSAGAMPVVYLSSMAVYGNAEGLISETAPLTAEQGDYAAAKLAGERLAENCPGAVVLRPGCVYGPGSTQWSLRIARLLKARRIGDLGAGGDGIANLVHVEDVARAVLAALQTPQAQGQAFNLAMADAPTWNDYFLQFAKALGAVPLARLSEKRQKIETKLLAPPLKILEILAGKAGLASLVPPLAPPSLARLWRQEIRLSSRKAEQVLGLAWTPLEQGVAEAAAWINGGL